MTRKLSIPGAARIPAGFRVATTILMLASGVWAGLPVSYGYATQTSLNKSAVIDVTYWDGNQISSIHYNYGQFVSHQLTSESGLEWPKGSGKHAVFASGMWWAAGKVNGSNQVRTAATEFVTEFQPGPIIEPDSAANALDPKYRIFEITRSEVDDFLTWYGGGQQGSIELSADFVNWPAEDGAPFVDVNGDGLYDANSGDYPEIVGDLYHWYVMNDLSSSLHAALFASQPMGIEGQVSLFGFDAAGPLGNIMFVKILAINKSVNTYGDMYVSVWSDTDLGDANDDLVGCDTTLSLGFFWNAPIDNVYGAKPPAVGYDFFQGPMVASVGDTAYMFGRNIPDYKNLPLTSFIKYINGGPPNLSDPEIASEAYDFMTGLDRQGNVITDPSGAVTTFFHPDDPNTGGWLDTGPADRRFLMSAGPFEMAPGDSQEIVTCIIVATGADNKGAITVVKYYDKFAQSAFDASFDLPQPIAPEVTIGELDEEIVLSWQRNAAKVEGFAQKGYQFQGYNIYQGGSKNGPWKRIATFDVVDFNKILLDEDLDETTGLVLATPVQFGDDSGIQRYFAVDKDYVRDTELANGRRYYFAVTSYIYTEDATKVPRVWESAKKALLAIPHKAPLGTDYGTEILSEVVVDHTSGSGEADIDIAVIDPLLLTGDDYEITFNADTSWNLVNLNSGDSLYEYNQDMAGIAPLDIKEGLRITLGDITYNPPVDVVTGSHEQTVNVDTSSSLALTGSITSLFSGTTGGTAYHYGLWNPNVPDTVTIGSTDPAVLMQDIEFVFSEPTGGQMGTYYRKSTNRNWLHDPASYNDVSFNWTDSNGVEQDTVLGVDNGPLPFEVYEQETGRQINAFVWLFKDKFSSNLRKEFTQYQVDEPMWTLGMIDTSGNYRFAPSIHVIGIVNTDYDPDATYTAGDAEASWMIGFDIGSIYSPGDRYVLRFANPIIPGTDIFSFTSPGVKVLTAGEDLKKQLDRINVFPNPYFGYNLEERFGNVRWVTFTNLDPAAVIRIYTISGSLVRKIEGFTSLPSDNSYNSGSSTLARWDLRNDAGIPVASGMYIAHVTIPGVGERVIKLAVFQPEERLDLF